MTKELFFEKWGPPESVDWQNFRDDLGKIAASWTPFDGPEYDEDIHPAPPDETDVLFFEQGATGSRIIIGRISRRCGTYGPSFATHWMPLPEPPESCGVKHGDTLDAIRLR